DLPLDQDIDGARDLVVGNDSLAGQQFVEAEDVPDIGVRELQTDSSTWRNTRYGCGVIRGRGLRKSMRERTKGDGKTEDKGTAGHVQVLAAKVTWVNFASFFGMEFTRLSFYRS